MKEELRQAAWLVLVAEVDLSRECSEVVHCTDACEEWYGLLETTAEGSEVRAALLCRERWRFVRRGDSESRDAEVPSQRATGYDASLRSMTPAADAILEPLIEDSRSRQRARRAPWVGAPEVEVTAQEANVAAVSQALLEPRRWRTVLAGAWRAPEAIHVLEARCALLGLVRLSRTERHHGRRALTLGHNLSSICASDKGRARDQALRAVVRRAGALCIATEIDWRCRHVTSEQCVADSASREAVRGPLPTGVVLHGSAARSLDLAWFSTLGLGDEVGPWPGRGRSGCAARAPPGLPPPPIAAADRSAAGRAPDRLSPIEW